MSLGPILPKKEHGTRAFEGLRNRRQWRKHLRHTTDESVHTVSEESTHGEMQPNAETAAEIEKVKQENGRG